MDPPTGPASTQSWRQRTPRQPHTPRQYNAQLGHSYSKKWTSPSQQANKHNNGRTPGSYGRPNRTPASNYKSAIVASGNNNSSRALVLQPTGVAGSGHAQYNFERSQVCPRSFVWPENFDVRQHKEEWTAMRRKQNFETAKKRRAEREERRRLEVAIGECFPDPTPIRPLLDGRTMMGRFIHPEYVHVTIPAENFSPVLTLQTVFHPGNERWKQDIAPWPSDHESKYEGDGRPGSKNEYIHGRFLPLPRCKDHSGNNWQQRALAEQYPLDDRYTNMDFHVEHFNYQDKYGRWTEDFHMNPYMINWQEVWFRSYRVPDLEFESYYAGPCPAERDGKWVIDDDGMHALSAELLAELEHPGYYGAR